MIIAVDFDGTLVENNYPEIGKINKKLWTILLKLQKQGHSIILWTCRSDDDLNKALEFCKSHGLFFDAVNANTEDQLKKFPNDGRKIYADIYLDDHALNIKQFKKLNKIK